MKVLAVCGSCRQGSNTEIMLKRALDGAKAGGAAIELVMLRDRQIEICDGCESCQKTHSCRISDDIPAVYEKVLNCNALLLGSPNYFNNVSALMKKFIDRMNPYWQSPKLLGKKAGTICVGGYSMDSVRKCEESLEEFCRICRMDVAGTVKATADGPREILQNDAALNECVELGKKIVEVLKNEC